MIITDGSLRTMEKQKVQTGIVWITTGNIIAARFLSPPPGPLESPGGGGMAVPRSDVLVFGPICPGSAPDPGEIHRIWGGFTPN